MSADSFSASNPSRAFRRAGLGAILLVHFAALILVMVVLWKVVPPYRDLFQLSTINLPAHTQRLIKVSEYCVRNWSQYLLWGILADGTIVCALFVVFPRRRWILTTYSHLWLFAACFALFYIATGLSQGIIRMVQ